MSVQLTIGGITYNYPSTSDEAWGPDATNWAIAITQSTLQKSGGLFSLTGELDFGPNFGIKSLYYKTRSANIATSGQFRLSNSDVISFRNSGNSANLNFGPGSSDAVPQYNSIDLVNLSTAQTLTNKTLTSPTVTGGSFSSPSITSPTVSGGSFTSPTISGPSVSGGTFSSPTINNPTITGTATFVDLSTSGTTTLGDSSSDTIVLNARFASSMIPSVTATYDIGTSLLKWKDIYLSGQVNTATLVTSGNAAVNSLNVTGTTTLDTSLTGVVKAVSGVLSASTIVNADVNASAAIAYSKLNLTGSIVNADVNASAAIAYSKLNLSGSIVNADINSSAAIAGTKISPNFGSQNITNSGNINLLTQSEIRFEDAAGGQYVGFKAPTTVTTGTYTLPASFPGSNQILQSDSSGVLSWTPAGSGDVAGPGSSTDNAVARFDGTTGKLIQNSVVIIGDTGNVTGIVDLTVTGTTTLNTSLTGVVKAVSGVLSASTIVNADVNASAAIAGTKISPNFGSQNVSTTGNVSAAVFQAGDGSAGTPSISFSNSLTTGLYRLAANQIGIATAGVKMASFDDAGQARFGNPQALSTNHGFFKDVSAGDTNTDVSILLGNSGGGQGATQFTYRNAAATAAPFFNLEFTPRNNADTSVVLAGRILMQKGGGNDAGTMTFYTSTTGGTSTQALFLNETQQALFASGGASAPSIGFASSSGTGFYRLAANQIGISTAGVKAGSIDDAAQFRFGNAQAGNTTHGFFKDVNAGDTSTQVQVLIGNSGGAQGQTALQYNNRPATGTPSAVWLFDPRNNADSGDYAAGSLQFAKGSATNTSSLSLNLYENTAGAGSFATFLFNGTIPTLQLGSTTFGTTFDIANAASAGALRLAGSANLTGGAVIFYSSTHATDANKTVFLNNSIISGYFDASNHLNLTEQHELRFQDAAGGQYVGFKAPSTVTSGTYTLPDALPSTNKVLQSDSSGVLSWVTGGGTGNVTGPGSSVDNTLPRFDGTSGVLLQGSSVVVDDSNNVSGVVDLTLTGNIVAGFVQEPLTSVSLTDNTTATFVTQTAASYTNLVIDYSIKRDTSRETGTLLVVHDGSTAEVNVNSITMGDTGTTFTADINGANLRVIYTTTSTGVSGTLNFSVKKWLTS